MIWGTYQRQWWFQSYQSKQINPDFTTLHIAERRINGFQSYQSKQINPDVSKYAHKAIPDAFQSYQSKQINPDPDTTDSSFQSKHCFNRINPNRLIPTGMRIADPACPEKEFQSYQSKQINPDVDGLVILLYGDACFNRINPNRLIPTVNMWQNPYRMQPSFNRINPNRLIPTTTEPLQRLKRSAFQSYQSKQINPDEFKQETYDRLLEVFQSYQSKQINPDPVTIFAAMAAVQLFQSYQSKQINPDQIWIDFEKISTSRFNRINPNRLIPTWKQECGRSIWRMAFQSYQSKQINPDYVESVLLACLDCFQSYQSKQINPDWASAGLNRGQIKNVFQSYQSKQINPDSYPRGASRGAALRCRMAEPIFWRSKWLKIIQ